MLKASVDLPLLLWLYVLLLHTRLDLHPEANIDLLNFLFATLRNQDKKVAFIQIDEDGALTRSSGFMKTFHNMNIIVQTKCGDASSLNGKMVIPNNTLYNITRAILVKSVHKK